jgi:hypothetical protein
MEITSIGRIFSGFHPIETHKKSENNRPLNCMMNLYSIVNKLNSFICFCLTFVAALYSCSMAVFSFDEDEM